MFKGGASLGQTLDEHKGIGPGFDFLRIFLAAMVLLTHSVEITRQGESTIVSHDGLLWWGRLFVVPAFFSLSGFLVAASIFRIRHVFRFLAMRGLRIYPALFVEIMLSAAILGPIVTTFPLSHYVLDPSLGHYLLNIFGIKIHYELPGVFTQNFIQQVNGSLWTVPSEMLCYASLAILMAIGGVFKPTRLCMAFVLGTLGVILYIYFRTGKIETSTANWLIIVLCFYAGVMMYVFRYRVFKNAPLVAACLAIFLVGIRVSPIVLIVMGPLAIAYVTVFLGLTHIPLPGLFKTGDYSYGVYLYGFPIQQTIAWAVHDRWPWWLNFALAAPLSLGIAALSWHLVEKRCMALRRFIVVRPLPMGPGPREEVAEPTALNAEGHPAPPGLR